MKNNNNYNNGTNSHTNKQKPSSKIIHTWLIRKKNQTTNSQKYSNFIRDDDNKHNCSSFGSHK